MRSISRLVCRVMGCNVHQAWHPSGYRLLCVRCHTSEVVTIEVIEPDLFVPDAWVNEALSPIKEERMQHVTERDTLIEQCDRCIQWARVAIDVGESQLLFCMHHYGQHLAALEDHEQYVIHHHPDMIDEEE